MLKRILYQAVPCFLILTSCVGVTVAADRGANPALVRTAELSSRGMHPRTPVRPAGDPSAKTLADINSRLNAMQQQINQLQSEISRLRQARASVGTGGASGGTAAEAKTLAAEARSIAFRAEQKADEALSTAAQALGAAQSN